MTGDNTFCDDGAAGGSASKGESVPADNTDAALAQACSNLHIAERVAYKSLEGDRVIRLAPQREYLAPVVPVRVPWTQGARPRHIVAYVVPVRPSWPGSCRRVLRF